MAAALGVGEQEEKVPGAPEVHGGTQMGFGWGEGYSTNEGTQCRSGVGGGGRAGPENSHNCSQQARQRHSVMYILERSFWSEASGRGKERGKTRFPSRLAVTQASKCVKAVETEGDDRIISCNPPRTPRGQNRLSLHGGRLLVLSRS